MKNTFVVSCPIDTFSGYGARSRDFVKALINLDKYDVKVVPQRWGNTPWGFIEEHEEWHFLKPHLLPAQQPISFKPDIWAQITVPNEFQPIGHYNIGLTAGIETTVCAPQWIEGLNRMDLNLVSSQHSKTVFETTQYEQKDSKTNQVVSHIKLNKPVEVLFEGVDLETYFPDTAPCLVDLDIKEQFAYLFVGHWLPGDFSEDRKNVGFMIKAFLETFKNKKKKPALVLKTSVSGNSYMGRDEVIKRIQAIIKTMNTSNLPNIYLLAGDFTDEEMNSIYNHSRIKAMVNLTKGEGYGRPLLEFSLTKKPIITSNWSGQTDFLKPEFIPMIGGELKDIHPSAQVKDMLIEGSKWFQANPGEVGYFLKDVFENYKKYEEGAKRQAHHSRTNFSFDNMQELLGKILEENVIDLPKTVELKMPSLTLPKLEKVNG